MRVAGKVAPVIEKPVPVRVAELIVTAVVPEEVNVSVCVEVVLIGSFPKASVPALRVNCGVDAVAPVPLSVTVLVLPIDELLETVMVPVAAPVTVGSKLT